MDEVGSGPAASRRFAASAVLVTPEVMYRNERRIVSLGMFRGGTVRDAIDLVAVGRTAVTTLPNAYFGRVMAAELTGEGFDIEPMGRIPLAVGDADRAKWEWSVTPQRSDVHTLRISAWVMTNAAPNGGVVSAAFKPVAVNVPVRWYPERLGDLVDDTESWFGRGENWLKALGALLVALAAAVTAIRALRRKS